MSLIIDLSDLRQRTGVSKGLHLSFDDIVLPEGITPLKPVSFYVGVLKTGFVYEFKGSFQAELQTSCSRCLTKMIFPLVGNFEEKLISEIDLNKISGSSREDIDEQYRIFARDDKIDLSEILLEHIYSALPFNYLCSPDCKGLCAKCGRNLNDENCECLIDEIDPRLKILANIKID